jgi:hypothetical protein
VAITPRKICLFAPRALQDHAVSVARWIVHSERAKIAEFALRQKTALFTAFREDAAAGALMAFGFNLDAVWTRDISLRAPALPIFLYSSPRCSRRSSI